MPEKDSLTERLDNAISGTPKLHPDEQRQYLGTFRERVSLLMPINQVEQGLFQSAFTKELTAHPEYQIIFNGHIAIESLQPYIKIAGHLGRAFTIVQDDFYGDSPENTGLVVISKTAINVYPIEADQKYATNDETSAKEDSQPSFWQRFKKNLGL